MEEIKLTSFKTGNTAVVKAKEEFLELTARQQILDLLDLPELKNTKIVFQPDVHAGKGATIGTTIKFNPFDETKINPEWVGNDIGCGLTSVRIGKIEDVHIDFDKLDELAKTLHEPIGEGSPKYLDLWTGVGRVSGGNHFMSIDTMDGYYWITVHNGSLNSGHRVYKKWSEAAKTQKVNTKDIIRSLKEQNKTQMIQPVLEFISSIEHEYTGNYLSGDSLFSYLYEVELCTKFARTNRLIVIQRVLGALFNLDDTPSVKNKWYEDENGLTFYSINLTNNGVTGSLKAEKHPTLSELPVLDSPHNYVKTRDNGEIVVHKGACSAELGEDVLIPINMRDGIIVGKGKGNEDWNYAAPHGAGRMMSRTQAKQNIKVDDYLEQMKDVRSISINEKTLDEAPEAYKPLDYILEQIQDTVDVTGIMKPIYNFKVAEEEPYWKRKKDK